MRKIDLENWPRRAHFEVFQKMDYPHFNLTANVTITKFYPLLKQQGISFTIGMMYLIAKTANGIPEFRHRIQGEEVVEFEVCHPSTTILTEEELFTYCAVDYSEDFLEFAARAAKQIAMVRDNPTLEDGDWRDSLLFMTSLPWVSFTSVIHPLHLSPADSVPRFAWGKYFEEGSILKIPLSVQAHHALMDGLHMGKFFNQIQAFLDNPEKALF